ncbi:MAG: sugar phosphate isomerase/epimerase family protein [Verrucomicrobiota bacterium]|nr:sugar phosphate isomerase/epimerase family protein [Verrucomicrobiota bacterium]
MKFGICTGLEGAQDAANAGFDYIEINVQAHLKPEAPEAEFLPVFKQIMSSPVPCYAANCFVPGHLKITGPAVNWDALEKYLVTAFARAERAGVRVIVFGSGGARQVPDGFSRSEANLQLARFGRLCDSLAKEHDVTVVVEPLNRGECNILNSVNEGAHLVHAVDLSHFRLLVDAYHWAKENEPAGDIVTHGALLKHAHIATYPARKAPGLEATDFQPFFNALKAAGYSGGLSIEGGWNSMAVDAAPALAEMRRCAIIAGYSV